MEVLNGSVKWCLVCLLVVFMILPLSKESGVSSVKVKTSSKNEDGSSSTEAPGETQQVFTPTKEWQTVNKGKFYRNCRTVTRKSDFRFLISGFTLTPYRCLRVNLTYHLYTIRDVLIDRNPPPANKQVNISGKA